MKPESLLNKLNVSRESLAALKTYVALLEKWQPRINLVASATLPEVWSRHVGDGLQLVEHIPADARTIVDIGSGGGVPGLILAIALADRPGLCVHLVESNGKKAAFLREAIRQTGAAAVVHADRLEKVLERGDISDPGVVTARAVAPLDRLLDLCAPLMEKGAICLFHKGQDVDTELTEATKYWKIGYTKSPSQIDSRGCILEIREIERVART